MTLIPGPPLSGESDWIEWTGGENPVPGARVNVRQRHYIDDDKSVWTSDEQDWANEGRSFDIIAYRVVSPAPEAAREEGEELKPCPFCGGRASPRTVLRALIQCDACGCESRSFSMVVCGEAAAVSEAIAAWNTRAALRPQAPAPDAGPVAWRWRFDDDGLTNWYFGPVAPGNKGAQRSMMEPVEVQPLYVRPAPATAPSDVDGATLPEDAFAYIEETFRLMIANKSPKGPLGSRVVSSGWRLKAIKAALTEAREQARRDVEALEPFALISTEGVVSAPTGHVSITTCAEYFHAAAARLAARTGGA